MEKHRCELIETSLEHDVGFFSHPKLKENQELINKLMMAKLLRTEQLTSEYMYHKSVSNFLHSLVSATTNSPPIDFWNMDNI